MRKFISLFFFSVLVFCAHAQQGVDYASIKLDTKEDYTEEVNKSVLQASNYILSTPIDKNNLQRLQAMQFLVRWMTGTPQYTFEIGEPAGKMTKDNEDLLIVYLAAMTKFCLEHPESKTDQSKIKLATVKEVLRYCEQNGVKLNSTLKKMKKANEAGELEKQLD